MLQDRPDWTLRQACSGCCRSPPSSKLRPSSASWLVIRPEGVASSDNCIPLPNLLRPRPRLRGQCDGIGNCRRLLREHGRGGRERGGALGLATTTVVAAGLEILRKTGRLAGRMICTSAKSKCYPTIELPFQPEPFGRRFDEQAGESAPSASPHCPEGRHPGGGMIPNHGCASRKNRGNAHFLPIIGRQVGAILLQLAAVVRPMQQRLPLASRHESRRARSCF